MGSAGTIGSEVVISVAAKLGNADWGILTRQG